MDSLEERAARTLHEHAEEFRKEGFDVLLEPRGENVPVFLRGFEPDLVATSSSKGNFVVEVNAGKHVASGTSERLAKIVEEQPGWHFKLILLAPDEEPAATNGNGSVADVERLLRDSTELMESNHLNAALLIAWSAFESAARRLLTPSEGPRKAAPPQAIIRQLVHLGYLAQSDVSRLTEISQRRSAVAHGFSATVHVDDVKALDHASRELLSLTAATASD